jgi:TPR repeat protein
LWPYKLISQNKRRLLNLTLIFSILACNLPIAASEKMENLVEETRFKAEHNDPEAQYNLGLLLDKGQGLAQDKLQAISWFRKAAEQDYAKAQFLLGILYDQGLNVPQDYSQALKWYQKAAEQGYAKAEYNLAAMYDEGLGVGQDYTQAALWYRKSAEHGYARAQFNLGSMYYKGEGVEQDNTLAYMWLQLAATQGLEKEVKIRNALEKNLTTAQIKTAKKLAKAWRVKHAKVQ